MIRPLVLACAIATANGRMAHAQLTRSDLTLPGVTFTINGGANQTADRDVRYLVTFSSSSKPLYRMAEGAEPTGGWSIAATSTSISGTLRLERGPESRRTLYLHIRRDAASPIVKREASITILYPRRAFVTTDPDRYENATSSLTGKLFEQASAAGYGFTRRLLTGDDCEFVSSTLSRFEAVGGKPSFPSVQTICEFKFMSGKLLPPGWTFKGAVVERWGGHPKGECLLHRTVAYSNNPTITVTVKHPGALIPAVNSDHSSCRFKQLEFYGPDDPDHDETAYDFFNPASGVSNQPARVPPGEEPDDESVRSR